MVEADEVDRPRPFEEDEGTGRGTLGGETGTKAGVEVVAEGSK